MKIIAIKENKTNVRIQSVNGLVLITEDWMKKKNQGLQTKQKKELIYEL